MARTENQRTAPPRGVTPAQLREAERGLKVVLAPTFTAAWIAQNHRDLLGEAAAEYTEWLSEHRPAPNPPGWLVERARWRALDLVARENRRSGPPLDSVIGSAEDPAPTPEETLLEGDRHRRIADALSHISEKDRKLLALVYYEGHSIIGAGRLLGWGKSRADRHHAAALERLRALVGPRDLLSPALVGLVAQATALGDRGRLVGGAVNRCSARAQDLADALARTVGSVKRSTEEAARRAAPFAETGTTPVPGGAGRVIAQCGALAAAACVARSFSRRSIAASKQCSRTALPTRRGEANLADRACSPTRRDRPHPAHHESPRRKSGNGHDRRRGRRLD